MASEPATARALLRSGPFDGLRESIRALGEYAAEAAAANGGAVAGGAASKLVGGFFTSLDAYDLVLADSVRCACMCEERRQWREA
jgi:hypothetical protein